MRPGRNDPCPCGSGRRYKHCCGLLPGAGGASAPEVSAASADSQGLIEAANRLRAEGRPREALSLYRQALEIDPRSAEGHNNLGNALCELSRFEEATASFRHALTLQADSVRAQLGLAAALRMQGQAAEAEASCQAALALAPHDVEALALLGELRVDRGRFSDARELFERALALDPDSASVYCSIAASRKMTAEDGAWLRGVETLLSRPLPLAHETGLRFALGKYFDDLGRYDEAFANYRLANAGARRSGPGYDPGKLTRRVDRIVAAYDGAFLRQPRSGASASELPVFIVGMPRSGTSLTEQILASHPAVFGAGELRFWNQAFNTLEAAQAKGEERARLLGEIARDYLARLPASASGALRVIDKMPANFLYAGLIHAVFPRARIIHLRRDPLDTCLSVYFQHFINRARYGNDLDDLAHYYREYVRITDHWRSVLPPSSLLEVPYEALLADQEGWTRRLLDFLGLPWDPRCLDFHLTERVVITASRMQVRQKLNAASVGRWRNYEKHLGPLRQLLAAT